MSDHCINLKIRKKKEKKGFLLESITKNGFKSNYFRVIFVKNYIIQ